MSALTKILANGVDRIVAGNRLSLQMRLAILLRSLLSSVLVHGGIPALAYAEEATRNKRVSDALRRHFADWEITEITWVNALENYYNLINLPLEMESDGLCSIVEARRH